jgi:hypothetical protein
MGRGAPHTARSWVLRGGEICSQVKGPQDGPAPRGIRPGTTPGKRPKSAWKAGIARPAQPGIGPGKACGGDRLDPLGARDQLDLRRGWHRLGRGAPNVSFCGARTYPDKEKAAEQADLTLNLKPARACPRPTMATAPTGWMG